MKKPNAAADQGKKVGSAHSGRRPATPLERARREAIKAHRNLEEIKKEFDERLALKGSTEARKEQVLEAARQRMAVARVVTDLREKTRLARQDARNKVPGASKRAKELSKQERAATLEMRDLPELGFTPDEWIEVRDAIEGSRGRGRMQLEIEVRLTRAEIAYDQAVEHLRSEEKKAGVPHIAVEDLPDPVASAGGKGIGRPKLDRLGLLDRQVAKLERDLEISTKELEDGDKSDQKFVNRVNKRIQRTNARLSDLRSTIRKEEEKLDELGVLNRRIKLMRDERRRHTLALNDDPENKELKQRHSELGRAVERLVAEVEVLEARLADDGPVETKPEVTMSEILSARNPAEVFKKVQKLEAATKKSAHSSVLAPAAAKAAPKDEPAPAVAEVPEVRVEERAPVSEPEPVAAVAEVPAAQSEEPPVVEAKAPAAPTAEALSEAPESRVEAMRRRAKARAEAAAVEERFVEIVEKLLSSDFDDTTAETLIEAADKKRVEDLSKIEGLDLIR